ncbi:MAG: phenylacetic acid degradation bifunctional protein PaaZ [Rhizobiaceae bacterium]|nr:phenylacetic acid degradation bifunctional protein PaaZ [Rhizobiaceae bacterium]
MSADPINVHSYCVGSWLPSQSAASRNARIIKSAVTGQEIAVAGGTGFDTVSMLNYARTIGGPALREQTFHDRARALKALATHLNDNKELLYELSYMAGSTRTDSWIDIDGGIMTLFAYASRGRREMPDSTVYLDGDVEQLSRNGTFIGQHICTPKLGVGVHINAFNFPIWGMLEKLAATLLAGMPAIVKPATDTCYITEACFRLMVDSQTFPAGAFQLIAGSTGDLLDQLTAQDVISFTGSAQTALMLRSNSHILSHCIPFISEQDSLNGSVLGPDAVPGTPEFDLFVKEVVGEMTTKAGQKCTAIRRLIVPQASIDNCIDALTSKLSKIKIGDPRLKSTQMGPVVSETQRGDVLKINRRLGHQAQMVTSSNAVTVDGADRDLGAFIAPTLYHCADPDAATSVHELEAFGPTATIMPYRDLDHACQLLNRGGGSLVASLFTHDPQVATQMATGSAAWHGRIYINDRTSAKESTGHGSPLPHMTHGGPGRAGGGEELGGIRSVMHYMQRTAIQGSPNMIAAVGKTWVPNADTISGDAHPFTRTFDELQLGETLHTKSRKINLEDIEHFAHFTGDTFYAHMDDEAAKANPFFPGRVAHGYLLLSFAAGLFVEPDPGPVLANTGLTDLAFQKPVSPGDSIRVELTVKRKTKRNDDYGEVRWNVALFNQDDEPVATYTLHTMNAY